jgi:competence ComEA-like helix-hairpin-helix protein
MDQVQPHPHFRYRLRFAVILCLAVFLPAFLVMAKKKPPDHPIDLNVANIKELEELPGVGPTTAQAIIDFREKSGRFKRVEDLLVIRGISEAKLQKMRPYLTIGPPPAPPKAATTQSSTKPKTSAPQKAPPQQAAPPS